MALLQNAAFYLLPFLLVITVVVTVHEFGHFLAARAFGVAVDRFAIGLGRPLISWTDRVGVQWRIGWLPLGGYVRYAGDENAASVPDKEDLETMRSEIISREGAGSERRYYHFKPLWQRTIIVLAGPAANFVLAVALFGAAFWAFGQLVTPPKVVAVTPSSVAAAAGFQAGDVLLATDGRPMKSFEDIQFYVQYRANTPIRFTVERGAQTFDVTASPRAVQKPSPFGGVETIGQLGLVAAGGVFHHYGPIEAVGLGANRTWQVAATTFFYLGRIFTGQAPANQLHSIFGIAHATGDLTRQAVNSAKAGQGSPIPATVFFLIQITALISVSVGLFNLLPIPVLDGGHLLFHAYEAVARHPPRASVQAVGYRVGLALIVSLMLFASWNDLHRWRVFHIIGS
jgi:regulator of sigma E protease